MTSDYTNDLVEVKWKNISFPISDINFSFDHTLVEHKYPNRNSAHIENMGRYPISISAKAIFDKNVSPGPSEAVQLAAVNQNVCATMFIKNPTESVQLYIG